MFEREPKFEADLLAKTKSMTEAWPLLSSLVGMFGLFMSLNEKPLSHSSVCLVHRLGLRTPLSHLGSLMFQSPAKIIRVEWCGMYCCRWSAVHSQVGLLLEFWVVWL